MANVLALNVYKINNTAQPEVLTLGFPVASCLFRETPDDRIDVNGTDCYGIVQFNNNLHYVVETVSQLATAANS